MKTIIKQTESNILYHHTGMTRFTGCQCFKDCSCNEDFTPKPYDFYTVKRIGIKTTNHFSLEEANIRYGYVNQLNKQLKK